MGMSDQEAPLRAAQAVKILRALEAGASALPGGLHLWIAPDNADFIGHSLVHVEGRMFEAADLADALGQALTWLAAEHDLEF